MMTIYRTPDCPRCTALEDVLDQLPLSVQVVQVESFTEIPHDLRSLSGPPILQDGETLIQGSQNIVRYLEENYENFGELWRTMRSDACMCERGESVQNDF